MTHNNTQEYSDTESENEIEDKGTGSKGLETLKNALLNIGIDGCAYCQVCNQTSLQLKDGFQITYLDKLYKCVLGKLENGGIIPQTYSISPSTVSSKLNLNINSGNLPFVVLLKENTTPQVCTIESGDYKDYCTMSSPFTNTNFVNSVISQLNSCAGTKLIGYQSSIDIKEDDKSYPPTNPVLAE